VLHFRRCGLGALVALLWTACAATASAGATPALSWLGPVPVGQPTAASAISCASTALCVAVDDEGHARVSTDPAAGLGATWTPVDVDEGHPLTGVSCPSAALCVAVDDEGHARVSTDPAAGASATWTRVDVDEGRPLTGVSCASPALCVAVDGEGRAAVSTDPRAGWSAATEIDPGEALGAVSCPTEALCIAVDEAGRALVSGAPTTGAPSWRPRSIDPSLGLDAISCTSSGLCVAVDTAGDALASANVAAQTPTWSVTQIDTLAAPSGVSCTAAGLCAVVDDAGRTLASDSPTAAVPAWPQSGPVAASGYAGVACVPEGLCAALDTGGQAYVGQVPAPAVATGRPAEVSETAAGVTGTVNPNDAALTECRFEYGLSVTYGRSVPCATQPAPGGAATATGAQLAGLAGNTTYHYRVAAASAIGTTYGLDETFKTKTPALVQPHPSVSGIPAPGQRLSCHAGVGATGVTLVYAWLRDLNAIRGAGGSTYTIGGADVSHHLQCQVTATNAAGSATAASAFVTVPAGGLGAISETTVGAARAAGTAVSVPLTCSREAAGSCTIALRLTVVETLRGSSVVAVAARRAPATRRATVTVGANTVRLAPGQRRTVTVALNATGRRLLAHLRRLTVRLSVAGTIVGAIRASLQSATVTLTRATTSSHKSAYRGRPSRSARRRR
jgi:hypothetical protein